MLAGYEPMEQLIAEERRQLLEEGIEPHALEAAAAEANRRRLGEADEQTVWAVFQGLPQRKDFGFVEPSDLAGIRAARPQPVAVNRFAAGAEVLFDKLYGAWLGRCVGCALGRPVEWWRHPHNALQSWQRQKRYLTALAPEEWPLRDYFPSHSPAEQETATVRWPPSCREGIAFMEPDDDIRYTILGQCVLRQFGLGFGSAHVAQTWFGRLSYRMIYTAETQAYRNMVIRYSDYRRPEGPARMAELETETDWHWVSHSLNPYREWIGAQIRVDSYGYAAPGNPELAAEMAWRDARISHAKNGIYGAMFCAAMIATAFVSNDPRQVVEAGLSQIPRSSRLHADIREVIALCARHGNEFARFEQVIEEIYATFGHYSSFHTNNNAAVCAAAVLLSGGDFHKGITFAVMAGWDTDCNGATVGSIVGAMTGADAAPRHWTGRLNDTLQSLIIDYHPIAISECARRSVEIVQASGNLGG